MSEGVAVLAASSSLLKRPSLVRLVLEYAVASRQPQAVKDLLGLLPVAARSRSTYHKALRCFSSAGQWGEVAALLKEMADDRQLPADADTFLELLQGASEHGQSLTRVQRYAVKMERAVRQTDRQPPTSSSITGRLLPAWRLTCCCGVGGAGPAAVGVARACADAGLPGLQQAGQRAGPAPTARARHRPGLPAAGPQGGRHDRAARGRHRVSS